MKVTGPSVLIIEPVNSVFIDAPIAGHNLRFYMPENLHSSLVCAPVFVGADSVVLAAYIPADIIPPRIVFCRTQNVQKVLATILSATPDASKHTLTGFDLDSSYPAILIDNFAALAQLEGHLIKQRALTAMRQGVRIRDPNTTYIRGELTCGIGVEIEANVIIEGVVVLCDGVTIGANSIVRNATIGKNSTVNPFSLIDTSCVGENSFVGPYGRIRPGSTLGNRVQIGNYVEIKASTIGDDCRINHHSFIGDAEIAEQVTIGAGTITCNHDGMNVNKTIIERGAYVGSGCNLIAPVRVGSDATIGAGSTITRDVPPSKLTLARIPQITIANWCAPRANTEKT